MRFYYPGVVARFQKSAAWHKERYGIKPHFGYFWNMCINGIFPGMDRVHCLPHADAKNPIGICVLYVYCLPGCKSAMLPIYLALLTFSAKFNSKERSWLVIWELGIVLELPPGVIALYPSSLFLHWNVDVRGT